MALKESKRGGNRITTNVMGRPYFYHIDFVTNSTNAPDGVAPSAAVTVARSTVGTFTLTFAEECKPAVVHWGDCQPVLDSTFGVTYTGHFGGYVASTGVATVYIANAAGGATRAIDDTTDLSVSVTLLCNGVSKVAS